MKKHYRDTSPAQQVLTNSTGTNLEDEGDDPGRHGGGGGGAGVRGGAKVVQVRRHHLPLTRRARASTHTQTIFTSCKWHCFKYEGTGSLVRYHRLRLPTAHENDK